MPACAVKRTRLAPSCSPRRRRRRRPGSGLPRRRCRPRAACRAREEHVSIVTGPLCVGVQRYQTDRPPAIPAWSGSPSSRVAVSSSSPNGAGAGDVGRAVAVVVGRRERERQREAALGERACAVDRDEPRARRAAAARPGSSRRRRSCDDDAVRRRAPARCRSRPRAPASPTRPSGTPAARRCAGRSRRSGTRRSGRRRRRRWSGSSASWPALTVLPEGRPGEQRRRVRDVVVDRAEREIQVERALDVAVAGHGDPVRRPAHDMPAQRACPCPPAHSRWRRRWRRQLEAGHAGASCGVQRDRGVQRLRRAGVDAQRRRARRRPAVPDRRHAAGAGVVGLAALQAAVDGRPGGRHGCEEPTFVAAAKASLTGARRALSRTAGASTCRPCRRRCDRSCPRSRRSAAAPGPSRRHTAARARGDRDERRDRRAGVDRDARAELGSVAVERWQ